MEPNAIDAYIDEQPEAIRPLLRDVRRVIRKSLSEAAEKISWGMPTWWDRHNLIHFAAQKHHLGVYPGEEAAAQFAPRLTEYSVSKGTIRLPYDRELPKALIQRIARWCYDACGKSQ